MNKKTMMLAVLSVSVLLIVSYCHFFGAKTDNTEGLPADLADSAMVMTKAEPPPIELSAEEPTNAFLPTEMEDSNKFELYKKNLNDMAVCLNLEMKSLDKSAQIDFNVLNEVINPDLGDIIQQEQEWILTDLRTKDGELRRIYVENILEEDEKPSSRKLRYYSFSRDGQQKELPLEKEQMLNPSDDFIASLEKDGDVIGQSLSRRIYYQNGDALLLVEKNGQVFSFELAHDGKVYRCTGADKAQTFNCECQ